MSLPSLWKATKRRNQHQVRIKKIFHSHTQRIPCALYSTVQYSTVQYSTVQYSTVQYSTVQYSTVQYSTVQYSTVQYCIAVSVETGI